MKSIVVYFSQTGNTRRIAPAIREGMNVSINESDERI
jgi:flavodoxin